MKTPEEIKRGLECCYGDKERRLCEKCPNGVEVEGYSEIMCANFDSLGENALAYIQQLEAQVPKWISVEERLPEEHERVLVAIQLDNRLSIHTTGFAGGEWLVTFEDCEHVTHWMPLPPSPKEG